MYTAYVLTEEARETLKDKFPPRYSKFIGHHVTIEFGVPDDTELPEEAVVKVIGRVDSGGGLEALIVSVNGSTKRPDGGTYHITWSLNPESYSPKDSNQLIKDKYRYTMSLPIEIETVPNILK